MTDLNSQDIEREAHRLRAEEVSRLMNELRAWIVRKVADLAEVFAAFRRTPGLRA
jgi:hypothetical protein